MRPKDIVAAYSAIHELNKTVLPFKAARGVAALKKRLTEEFEVVADMEKALVEKHGGKSAKSGGYIFTEGNREAFAQEYEAAMEQDADIDLPTVDLSAHTDALRLSPSALEALEGLIIFDRGDGHGG